MGLEPLIHRDQFRESTPSAILLKIFQIEKAENIGLLNRFTQYPHIEMIRRQTSFMVSVITPTLIKHLANLQNVVNQIRLLNMVVDG